MRIDTHIRRCSDGEVPRCRVCCALLPADAKHQRRRDPWGNYYCDLHGSLIQRRILALVQSDDELASYLCRVPCLFFYMDPGLVGLRMEPSVTYASPTLIPLPSLRIKRPRCSQCDKSLAGEHVRYVGSDALCNKCGLQLRRSYTRQALADSALVNATRINPSILKRVRPEVRLWVSKRIHTHINRI